MSLKHITFIRPNIQRMRSTDAMEPLVFAILAGRTPAGIELALYDDRLEEIPYDIDTDLVAMTVETFTARRAYQIAARFRQRGIPVVMGGFHPTLMPEEAGRHCDAVVMGDAEGVWEQVVADAGRGRSFLQRIYRQDTPPEMAGLRFERSIFAGKKYAPVALVQYGRGCRFACDFCSIIAFYGRHRAQRPPAEVAEELRALKRKIVLFVDDNLFSDQRSFEALLDAVTPLGIRWVCQITLDIVRHEDLLHKMAKSGCIAVTIGFESLDNRNLKQMGKGWSRLDHHEQALAKFRSLGIMVYGTFVFGYDHDSKEAFEETVAFANRERFFLANFNPLTPTPGTPLYDRLMAEQRMIHPEWWLDPDYRYGRAVFRPLGLTEEELTRGVFRARSSFYRVGNILRRALLSPGMFLRPYHLWVYFFANLVSRLEIQRKQDIPFGDPSPCSPGGGD